MEDFLINRHDWWEHDPLDYDNTLSVVLEVAEVFKQVLCPILNEITNYKSYLEFINRYELKRHGRIIWNDDFKMFTYLKTSEYEKVLKVINAIEFQNKDAAEANNLLFTEDEYIEYLEEINEELDKLYKIREAVNEKNTEFINHLLSIIENDTKGLLARYGVNFKS